MDSRTCQTSAASPAEPGGLPFGLEHQSSPLRPPPRSEQFPNPTNLQNPWSAVRSGSPLSLLPHKRCPIRTICPLPISRAGEG